MRIIEDIQENNDLLHIGSMYRISPYFLCFIFLLYMYEDEWKSMNILKIIVIES